MDRSEYTTNQRQIGNGFNPRPWARNPHLQSIFASLHLRTLGGNEMVDHADEVIVDGGNGVRLLGYHSRRPDGEGKALVLIIHGWEGSSNSTYVLHTGEYLFKRGCDIFRLNLRDHGESHHLNEGLFHGALTEETITAVRNASQLAGNRPFFVVGFSLGGNFALRVALHTKRIAVQNLRHVICISPLIDPYKSVLCIDRGPAVYRYYFVRKWRKSLRKKQELFPRLYNFEDLLHTNDSLEMTKILVNRYTPFRDYRDYFNQYTLLGDTLGDIAVPVTVVTSEDDPMIPVTDFYNIRANHHMNLIIHRYGGHCGFLDPFPFGCWYEPQICRIVEQYEKPS